MGQVSQLIQGLSLSVQRILAGAPGWVDSLLGWLQQDNRGFYLCLAIEAALLVSLVSRVAAQLLSERRARAVSAEHSRKIIFRGQISAADQGSSRAQHRLARMYAQGQEVKRDYVQAHMWYSLAAAGGIKEANKGLEAVSREMTPDQIAKAQELAAKRRRSSD
jgi:TPR repeat protein